MFALRASKQMTINNQPPMFRFAIKPVVFVVFRVKVSNLFLGVAELEIDYCLDNKDDLTFHSSLHKCQFQ